MAYLTESINNLPGNINVSAGHLKQENMHNDTDTCEQNSTQWWEAAILDVFKWPWVCLDPSRIP